MTGTKRGITKKAIISILKQEIEWWNRYPMNMPEDYRAGFVDGLKKAITLIEKMRISHDQSIP